jgi:hypothetical protein
MSPLERYQSDKRSGAYHPETEKNWPEKKPETQETDSSISEEKPQNVRTYTNSNNEMLYIKLLALWCALLTIAVAYLYLTPPEIQTKTITKKVAYKVPQVKKQYIVPSSYRHAKENLATANARIGRLVAELKSKPDCTDAKPVLKFRSRTIRLKRLN